MVVDVLSTARRRRRRDGRVRRGDLRTDRGSPAPAHHTRRQDRRPSRRGDPVRAGVPPGPPPPPTGDDLTSLAVYIAHDRVGALLSVLMELAVRGVNLTRIESRPTGEALGRYVFFLDCTGHVADVRLGEALQGLRRVCADVRFLGSYPRHRWTDTLGERPVPPPAGLADVDYTDAAAWLARLRAGELT
ncbi:ACT domain-containing protein [Micromonospora sp. M12]